MSREKTCCHHFMGYFLAARVPLYKLSHRWPLLQQAVGCFKQHCFLILFVSILVTQVVEHRLE